MPRATSPGWALAPVNDTYERLTLRLGTLSERRAVLHESASVWAGDLSSSQFTVLNLMSDRSSDVKFLTLVDEPAAVEINPSAASSPTTAVAIPHADVYGSAELWPRTAYVVLPGSDEVTELRAACLHRAFEQTR